MPIRRRSRQGFRWWEYDPTYYTLRVLSWLGIVWDLHLPPPAVVKGEHRLGRLVIDKVASQLAVSFPVNHIARQALEALARAPGWTELKSRLRIGPDPGGGILERDRPAAGANS